MAVTLHQLLKTLVEQGGTDLHITTNSPPQIRVDGNLVPLQLPPLTAPETKALAYSVLTDNQKHRFEENLELDFSLTWVCPTSWPPSARSRAGSSS